MAAAPGRGVEVRIPRGPEGTAIPAYAVLPPGAGRGVVVLHEIYGRAPDMERVADRFAAAGYAAVLPDLFASGRLACIRRSLAAVATGRGPSLDEIRAAHAWLCREAHLRERSVGVIGFCLGGGFALAVGHGFGAVSTNYGRIPPREVLRGSPPVIGCYGGRDRIFARAGERLASVMDDLGVPREVHTFPTAGHSFLTDGRRPLIDALSRPLLHISFDAEVAEEGWRKILAFFERHLA